MKISRKSMTAASAAAFAGIGIVRYPAGAAEFSYKLGDDTPATHPVHVYAAKAADKIKEETGGRLEIRTFANSALGGQQNMVSQARLGALEFLLVADNVLQAVVPVTALSVVPFAFSGYQAGWAAAQGALGKYIRSAIAKAPINLFTFEETWDAGFRQLVNGVRPIESPDDLKGLRMRTPPTPMIVAMFKAFGAAPTAVEGSEMYLALQTHLVDGLENPLVGIESNKLYEVSKYVSVTNHVWTRYELHVNTAAWERLPKDLREVAERNLNAAAIAERNEVARGEAALETSLKGKGMQFSHPNPAPFKAALQAAGLYQQWRDAFGTEAWSLLEKSVGKLA